MAFHLARGRKSQGSPEFNVVVSFVLLLFLIILLISFQKQDEMNDLQVFLDAKRVAQTLADNIDMISRNGDGYYRYFSLPEYLHGHLAYEINTSDNFVWINYTDTTWATSIITSNVTILHIEMGEDKRNCIINEHGGILINDVCGLSDQGCGTEQIRVQSAYYTHNSNCYSPEPVTINQNSLSTCPSYGCSDHEWHFYKVVPDRDGQLNVTFSGTGTMVGIDKTDLIVYPYTKDGNICKLQDSTPPCNYCLMQMEPQASRQIDVDGGNVYIIALDVDTQTGDCSKGGSYWLKTELK
jgi:hypothetical protein